MDAGESPYVMVSHDVQLCTNLSIISTARALFWPPGSYRATTRNHVNGTPIAKKTD